MSEIPHIGELDRFITLKSLSTVNTKGSVAKSYTTLDQVWAKFTETGGEEKREDGRLTAVTKTDFIIRYRSDVDKTTRIVYDSTTYDIEAIQQLGRRRFLKITTEARDGN